MVKHTRKRKGGVMTIPQLRKAFDHIETRTHDILTRYSDKKSRREAFQAEWKKVFHRDVDAGAADAYLDFASKKKRRAGAGATRKTKQRGGMAALAGAPLDYSTRPGVYGPYGVFPAYVSSGFDFYNSINKDSLTEQCGKENITPKLPADIGSNVVGQKGGRRTTRRQKTRKQRGAGFPSISEFASAVSMRPFEVSVPTSPVYDAQMAFKGQHLPPSPSPVTSQPGYATPPMIPLDAKALNYQRDLGREFTTPF
jgi:hypothetical protein